MNQSGERLIELVAVMDQLRSPGGCPWDAEQTHASLLPYLIEETYELVDAIENGDPGGMVEELGDVLLQVVFHARVAQENPNRPFTIDDVAGRLIDKLRRRHPHVFADTQADTPQQVAANWNAIKAQEKPERRGPLDGIPTAMPALERAAAVVDKLIGSGRSDLLPGASTGDDIGTQLLALVVRARREGVDPAAHLRATLRAVAVNLPTSPARPAGTGAVG